MTREVIWRSAALAELAKAALWYESQRAGLGQEFVSEVDRCVEAARSHPLHYRAVKAPIRRVLLQRFPYCLYFYLSGYDLVILALHHAKRSPKVWEGRRE